MYPKRWLQCILTLALVAPVLGTFPGAHTAHVIAAANGCIAPPPGLVNWYPGEGNANDVQGGANGTTSDGTITYIPGEVGQAFQFDGTSAFTAPVTAMQNLPLTIAAWAAPALRNDADPLAYLNYPDNAVSNDSPGSYGRGFGINVYTQAPSITSTLTVEYNDGWRILPISLTAGQFYFVAVVYTPGEVKTYLDGGLVDDATFPLTTDTGGSYVRIGKHNDDSAFYGSRRFFQGALDEVQIYQSALSAADIQGIYAAGSAGLCGATQPTSTPTATSTPTNTPTSTATATPTNTPTSTATATPTSTATATPTDMPTNTPTSTATATPQQGLVPTSTATATPTRPRATATRVAVSPCRRALPLHVRLARRTVRSAGTIVIRAQTVSRARLTVWVQVLAKKTVVTGRGTHRRRVIRTIVLYRARVTGRADARGRFQGRVHVTYKAARKSRALLTVTAHAGCVAATARLGMTILPKPRHLPRRRH